MVETICISFVVFMIVIAGMAIGLLKGNVLQGSCGGLGKILGLKCFFCDKRDECPLKLK